MIHITSNTPKKHFLFQWDDAYNALDIVYESGEIQLKISAELKPHEIDIKNKRCNIMDINMVTVKFQNLNALSDDERAFIYKNTDTILNKAVKQNLIHFDTRKDYLRFVSKYLTENGVNESDWFPFPG